MAGPQIEAAEIPLPRAARAAVATVALPLIYLGIPPGQAVQRGEQIVRGKIAANRGDPLKQLEVALREAGLLQPGESAAALVDMTGELAAQAA